MHQGQQARDLSQNGIFDSENLEWYPLQVRYQCEKRVDDSLRLEGFEAFTPTWRQTRRWSDRVKVMDAPLFPGYTFVRMEALPELMVKVLRLPGLVRFVTSGRDLVPVPGAEIDAIRTLAKSNSSYEPGPFPAMGEKIRIRGGLLEGIEGILVAQTGLKEIVISVGAIQRSLKIPLAGYQIERIA